MNRNEILKTENSSRPMSTLSKQFPEVLQFAKGIKNNQTLSKNFYSSISVNNSVKLTHNNLKGNLPHSSTHHFNKRDHEINLENLRDENLKIKGTLNNYMLENIKLSSEMMKMEKDFRKNDKLEKFVEEVKEKKKSINEDEIIAKLKKVIFPL